MINEIREILKDGYGARLELVDREEIRGTGILYTHYHSALSKYGKNSSLTVIKEENAHLILEEEVDGMPIKLPKDVLHLFKLTGIVPTLYRVIDVALDAVKNGVAVITHLKADEIVIESIDYDSKSPFEVFKDDPLEKFQDAIEWIGSLYTETFVIESDSDIERLQDGAEITLSNNERGVFNIIGGLRSITNLKTNDVVMGLNIFFLKGATVIQKRGSHE